MAQWHKRVTVDTTVVSLIPTQGNELFNFVPSLWQEAALNATQQAVPPAAESGRPSTYPAVCGIQREAKKKLIIKSLCTLILEFLKYII